MLDLNKYLVVNADDFGIDEGINKGIADCFGRGIITSVSMVPNGAAFENAVHLVKQNPDIGIGVHLCLTGERAVLPKERIRSLADDEGFLPHNVYILFLKICKNRISLSEVKKELEAQIEKVFDSGIAPFHIDSHQYSHLIPPFLDIVIELAKKYRIKWIRYPNRDKSGRLISFAAGIKKTYLHFCSKIQLKVLQKNNIGYPDFSYGILANGNLDEPIFMHFIKNLRPGLNDITCHPGSFPEDKRYTAWAYHWEEEANILRSKNIKGLIENLNIEVTNYAKLTKNLRDKIMP